MKTPPIEPKVNRRFAALIPPPSDDQRSMLEARIIADKGCRDPLVVWKERNILLDGHTRLAICKEYDLHYKVKYETLPDRDAAIDRIYDIHLERRNLTPSQWDVLLGRRYNRAKKPHGGDRKSSDQNGHLIPERTAEAFAKKWGVSATTVKRDGKLAEWLHEYPDEEEAVMQNRKPLREAKRDVDQQMRTDARTAALAKAPKLDKHIIVGDFRDHFDKVADGSLSLIFTDIPYDEKGTKMVPGLAEFAADKLADGGSLMFYLGHIQLPAAMHHLRRQPHLRYWWVMASINEGSKQKCLPRGIQEGWTPLLWFVKECRDNNRVMVSDTQSHRKEKAYHEWQKPVSDALYWIERLCPPGGMVCDPFLGSGTTAAAAIRLGRKWIGFEKEKATAAVASERIHKARMREMVRRARRRGEPAKGPEVVATATT